MRGPKERATENRPPDQWRNMRGTNQTVARLSRTFTVNLSAAGVELFLECHHRLCQQTNELLPYGQTLHSALFHLSRLDGLLILDDLATLKVAGLLGDKPCFVGAPMVLAEKASGIASRIGEEVPSNRKPIVITKLFVVALKRFRLASPDDVLAAYVDMVQEVGDVIKIPGRRKALIASV